MNAKEILEELESLGTAQNRKIYRRHGAGELGDDYFEKRLETIEREIQSSKNRVRDAMNMALICIGTRSPKLE